MAQYEANPTRVDNLDFFTEKKSVSKRGHNSRRDKRIRWMEKHPASGKYVRFFKKLHGR